MEIIKLFFVKIFSYCNLIETTSTKSYKPVLNLVAGYNINKKIDLYLGYKHIFADNLNKTSDVFHKFDANPNSPDVYKGVATVDSVNIGLAYHF